MAFYTKQDFLLHINRYHFDGPSSSKSKEIPTLSSPGGTVCNAVSTVSEHLSQLQTAGEDETVVERSTLLGIMKIVTEDTGTLRKCS